VGTLAEWRRRANELKSDIFALYLAARDPRVPWYAKALALLVTTYAFSPIDLIPDFIPVLGYVDDLVLLPLGIALTLRLIPAPIWAECRMRARDESAVQSRAGWVAAGIIVILWLLAIIWLARSVSMTWSAHAVSMRGDEMASVVALKVLPLFGETGGQRVPPWLTHSPRWSCWPGDYTISRRCAESYAPPPRRSSGTTSRPMQ
jgi:uncharacterized membrane protein YkvA (DUF1232 family)